jgi:hypothetical protein
VFGGGWGGLSVYGFHPEGLFVGYCWSCLGMGWLCVVFRLWVGSVLSGCGSPIFMLCLELVKVVHPFFCGWC